MVPIEFQKCKHFSVLNYYSLIKFSLNVFQCYDIMNFQDGRSLITLFYKLLALFINVFGLDFNK